MGDPTAERIWDATLGQLQIHVTRPNYDTWLKDTKGLRFGDGQFVVGVPTEFVKEWLATGHGAIRLVGWEKVSWGQRTRYEVTMRDLLAL